MIIKYYYNILMQNSKSTSDYIFQSFGAPIVTSNNNFPKQDSKRDIEPDNTKIFDYHLSNFRTHNHNQNNFGADRCFLDNRNINDRKQNYSSLDRDMQFGRNSTMPVDRIQTKDTLNSKFNQH